MTPDQAREKVEKIYATCAHYTFGGYIKDHHDHFNTWYNDNQAAAQTLIASLAGEDWISVEDGLPEVGSGEAEEVIINSHVEGVDDVVLSAVFYSGRFYVGTEWNSAFPDENIPIREGRITHYMPLPKPPK